MLGKKIAAFANYLQEDSEAVSNKIFKMVADRERVEILPVEKLINIPANHKPPIVETEKEDSDNDIQKESSDSNGMLIIER